MTVRDIGPGIDRAGVVSVQPVYGRSDDGDVSFSDRFGALLGVRGDARPQFRARLVLYDRGLSGVAGGAMAAAAAGAVLAGGPRRRARGGAARRRGGTAAAALPL